MLVSFTHRAIGALRTGQVRSVAVSGVGSAWRGLHSAIAVRGGVSRDDEPDYKTISVARLAGVTVLGVAAWVPIAAATAQFLS